MPAPRNPDSKRQRILRRLTAKKEAAPTVRALRLRRLVKRYGNYARVVVAGAPDMKVQYKGLLKQPKNALTRTQCKELVAKHQPSIAAACKAVLTRDELGKRALEFFNEKEWVAIVTAITTNELPFYSIRKEGDILTIYQIARLKIEQLVRQGELSGKGRDPAIALADEFGEGATLVHFFEARPEWVALGAQRVKKLTHAARLDPGYAGFLLRLAQGRTPYQIAAELNVPRSTLSTWMQQAETAPILRREHQR